MADEKTEKRAREVFETVCAAIEDHKWHYQKDEKEKVALFTVVGDDLPMAFVVQVDEERQLVRLASKLPFTFDTARRLEGSRVTNFINYKMVDGCFDFDCKEGLIAYRMTTSFRDSLISKELLIFMVEVACYTVDRYNDSLLMVSKGKMSVEDFIDEFR